MFERYTEKARRAVFFARYEASQYGSSEIDTEHLLLGLLRENKHLQRWLPNTTLEALQAKIDQHLARRAPTSTAVDLPLSAAAKRVLKYAADEAERLANKHIGTEHIFLGMLDEESCFAAKLLREGGTDGAEMRLHYAEQHSQPPKPWSFHRSSYRDLGFRVLSAETVEIHGSRWNVDYVRDAIGLSAGPTTGIGTRQPGSRETSRSSEKPAGSRSNWLSPPIRRISNSSELAGKKTIASSAAGSCLSQMTAPTTAPVIPTATTGCARNATQNSGSARISSLPHILRSLRKPVSTQGVTPVTFLPTPSCSTLVQ